MRSIFTFSLAVFFLFSQAIFAFTYPTATPPDGNVAAPINTSINSQVKSGGLSLGSLLVTGGTSILGALGIGITEPLASLHIKGGDTATQFFLEDADSTTYLRLGGFWNPGNNQTNFEIINDGVGGTLHMFRDEPGQLALGDINGVNQWGDYNYKLLVTGDSIFNGDIKISTGNDICITDGNCLSTSGSGSEPWFGIDDGLGATSNTEDIYMMGSVSIGENTAPAFNSLFVVNSLSEVDDEYAVEITSRTDGLIVHQPSDIGGGVDFDYTHPTLQLKRKSGSKGANLLIGNQNGGGYIYGSNEMGLGFYDTLDTSNQIMRIQNGDLIATNGNAGNRFIVSRYYNENQSLTMKTGDSGTIFQTYQDEAAGNRGNITFRMGNILGQEPIFTVEDFTSGVSDEKFRVDALTGNVGIGTTDPLEKLDVNGNIRVETGGDVCIVGGNCLSTAGGSASINHDLNNINSIQLLSVTGAHGETWTIPHSFGKIPKAIKFKNYIGQTGFDISEYWIWFDELGNSSRQFPTTLDVCRGSSVYKAGIINVTSSDIIIQWSSNTSYGSCNSADTARILYFYE